MLHMYKNPIIRCFTHYAVGHSVTDGGTYSIKMVNVLDIRGTP